MGKQISRSERCKPVTIKFKTEKDLPKKECKAMKSLLKTNPHLKHVPSKSVNQMTPREWILSKIGLFYVEPFLLSYQTGQMADIRVTVALIKINLPWSVILLL